MDVLVTGAFGNVGESTLIALSQTHHVIKCFDLRTKATEEKAKKLSEKIPIEVCWGDITEFSSVENAVKDVGCIIHLAAIIPPPSEANPELAKRVNVDGTKNIIDASESMQHKPKLIFTSSISTHGHRTPEDPPLRADMPQYPTDNYTHHKVECEKMIRSSNLDWTIVRLAAVPPLELAGDLDPSFFDMPYEQRIEFVHTRDVGKALATAVEADVLGKTLLIGGGERCQFTYGVFINEMMKAMGIGEFPQEAFKVPEKREDYYYTDWMDTEESERLLRYQEHTFEDFLVEMKERLGTRKYLMKLIGPLARRSILRKSPYL
jgi:nucleoside-diphosphate-sugar epimerase